MKKFLLIDGNSIINRAFYGIKMLTNKHGLYTNGIYGFLNILFKHEEQLNPDYIAVAFDLKAPTFRHKMYSGYKAQRKGMPDELAMQMPVMKEVLGAMNIAVLEKEGYEADDIIGTVSRICRENETECYILTGDRDDLQLASDTVKILLTVTKGGANATEELDSDDIEDRYGVTPTEFIDVKGLMGDSSDNVPGVKGIGEKTAFEYIKKFKSIENLYENLDDPIVKPAARKKLEEGKEMAILSKTLCTIDRNVPLDFSLDDATVKPYDTTRLTELFTNLEFSVFLKRISGDTPNANFDFPETEILSLAEAEETIKKCKENFVYKFFEKDGALCAAAFVSENKAYFVKSDAENVASVVKPCLENADLTKVSADIKADMVLAAKYGISFAGDYFDLGVAAYIINPLRSSYDVSDLAASHLSVNIKSDKDVFGSGKKMLSVSELSEEDVKSYVSQTLGVSEKIKIELEKQIKESGMTSLFYDIELPLVRVLADMEIEGVLIDRENLERFNEELKVSINALESEIYALAGEEFNINSPKQLGIIIFEKLGMKAAKKTKTGYSTNAEVLEKLRSEHEIVEKILEYRRLSKLNSTYGDGLLAVVNPKTGRIHSDFKQTVTVTGRISSAEPNLQNIPVRTEIGRELRKMFVAKEGYVLVDADYSQIELRVLAHISGDENLIAAFKNNEDIHTATAAGVFGVSPDEVTPLMRSRAKTINFGIIYGMGDFSLAKDLEISVKEAREYIENYFSRYPGVKKYMEHIIETTKESGFVSTMFERRRPIPEINSGNFMVRSSGERMARNTPIQGSAADIIKIAMVKVNHRLKEENLLSKLILQVHDELIIEAERSEAKLAANLLKECMESAVELCVPLVAETKTGHSWYDTK